LAPPDQRYTGDVLVKLGVRPGQRVAAIGIDEPGFVERLLEREVELSLERPQPGSDLIFVQANATRDLDRIQRLVRSIDPNGAIWVVWPKGRPELKEDHVRAAALPLGLVDVKVVAFSARLSALKLVVRKELRGRPSSGPPTKRRRSPKR
jgi:hypothetical protein